MGWSGRDPGVVRSRDGEDLGSSKVKGIVGCSKGILSKDILNFLNIFMSLIENQRQIEATQIMTN